METTPFLHPGFIVPMALGLIGFISWLVRLEGKAASALKAVEDLKHETEQIWAEHERHKENQDIHFNQKVSNAVEQGNTRRFETIETQLAVINSKLDRIAGRQ